MGKHIGTTVSDDMKNKLDKVSEDSGVPLARLTRQALIEWLERNGIVADNNITKWGGKREQKVERDE